MILKGLVIWALIVVTSGYHLHHSPNSIINISDTIDSHQFQAGDFLRLIAARDDLVYVGGRSTVHVLTSSLVPNTMVTWQPSAERIAQCESDRNQHCEANYIRTWLPLSISDTLVCGTYAHDPQCAIYTSSNAGYAQERTFSGVRVTPYRPDSNFHVMMSPSSGRLFTTMPQGHNSNPTIKFRETITSLSISEDQTTAPTYVDLRSDMSPPHLAPDTDFVDIGEWNDRVYMVFSEMASDRTQQARISQVCANDASQEEATTFLGKHFLTFVKANLKCESSLGLVFPLATAASLSESSTGSFVASFGMPARQIGGIAMCLFELANVEKVFATSDLAGRQPMPQPRLNNCTASQDAANLPDLVTRAYMVTLLHKPVKATAFFVDTQVDWDLRKIVVEWHVKVADGSSWNILTGGTSKGAVVTMAWSKSQSIFIESLAVFSSPVVDLLRMADGRIIVVNNTTVVSLAAERCGLRKTCASCLALRHPHCSWFQGRCGRHSQSDRLQSMDGSTAACPKVVEVSSTPRPSVNGATKAELALDSQDESGDSQLPLYICLTAVLCIICGVLIGGGIMLFYLRRRSTDPPSLGDGSDVALVNDLGKLVVNKQADTVAWNNAPVKRVYL